jgi:hypothetical protein
VARLTIEKFIINKMSNGFTVQISKVIEARVKVSKYGNLKHRVKVNERMSGTIGITK